MMRFEEFTLDWNEQKIFGRHVGNSDARGLILLVHGFGEHSGRYAHSLVPFLQEQGFAVVLYDHIGHGRSDGKRGYGPGLDGLLDLMDFIIAHAVSWYPDLPLFLYGHSMGGNLVLNYGIRRGKSISGIVASSPYLRLAFAPPKWKLLAGKLLYKLAPKVSMPSGMDTEGISRIPEEVKQYETDLLVHDRISPAYYFPIIKAGEWAITNADQLKTPTLIVHGSSDRIVDVNASREFHKNAAVTTLEILEGGYHELHHDLAREDFLARVKTWLRAQLP